MGAQLLVGLLLLFLCPGVYKVLLVSSKSLFLQSWVSSVGSVAGLLATSSKRAYAIPRSAAPRAPVPVAGHCWSLPPEEKLRHSSGSGLWVGHVFCALPRSEQLRQPGAWQVHCPSGPASQSPPGSLLLDFPGAL